MKTNYDVAILGAGMGGAMLACILAKRGLSTLLIEELSHPRFTIGESLIPETGVRLRILGEKYDVPELGWIGNFYALRDHVSPACGVKRSFVFCHHREGQAHRPEESNQLPTLTPPFGPDAHLFRQDVDAFLAAAAAAYGANLRQQLKITKIDFNPGEVVLHAPAGEKFTAKVLIDAGGMRSLVSQQLSLRDPVPRFATDSRVLYNHFTGIDPYDLIVGDKGHDVPSPFGQGTLHHVFDGGWIWVIPFNNHRDSTNPLTSVGLLLDRRKHPEPIGTPDEEFRSHVLRFPSVTKHFANARPIRPWIASGRLQYSSKQFVADRMIQLPHAGGFLDPLYSSGLSVLTVAIDLIADALFSAFRDDRFERERFQHIEDFVQNAFDHYDMVVSRSFDSWMDYDLWNAWNRNWVMGNYMGTWGVLNRVVWWLSTKDRKYLDSTSEMSRVGVLGSHLPELRELMKINAEDVGAAARGGLPPKEASRRIFERLGGTDFLPPYMGFGDAEQRTQATFTLPAGARHILWYQFVAPPRWKEYCGIGLFSYARQAMKFAASSMLSNFGRMSREMRDIFFAGNQDWTRRPRAMIAHGEKYVLDGAREPGEWLTPPALPAPELRPHQAVPSSTEARPSA